MKYKKTTQHIKEENKELHSEWHTLFKTEVPERNKQYKNKPTLFTKIPAHIQYRMFVDNFMEYERGLHKIYNELWNADQNDKLELRINSHGGFVNEGAQFYSIIKNKFKGRTTTVLDNCGYSMGAVTFCMGDKRIVTERSELMFHDYSTGMYGKAGEIDANHTHSKKHIRDFFKEIILDNGFLTKAEYDKMLIGKDYWMGATELCERGIATHILCNGKEITAKKYLKKQKNKKQKNKK